MPIKPLNKTFPFFDRGMYRQGSFTHLLPTEVKTPYSEGQVVKDKQPGPFPGSYWKNSDGQMILLVPTYGEVVLSFEYRQHYGQLPGLGWYTPEKGDEPILVCVKLLHQLIVLRDPMPTELEVVVCSDPARTPRWLKRNQVDFVGSRDLNCLATLSPQQKNIFTIYMRKYPEQLNWIDCWQHSLGRDFTTVDRVFWNKVLVQQKWEREEILTIQAGNSLIQTIPAELRKPENTQRKPVPPEIWQTIYVPCGYGHTHPRRDAFQSLVTPNTTLKKEMLEGMEEIEFFDLEFWIRLLHEAQLEKEQMEVWSQEWQTQLPLTWPSIPLPRFYFELWSQADKQAATELGFRVDEAITTPLMQRVVKREDRFHVVSNSPLPHLIAFPL